MDLSTALDEQRSFIEHPTDLPNLLAAGPGTGKTWVLERRSEFLTEGGVDPGGIGVLTLTRSLAAELSLNRLGDAWGRVVVTPWERREIVREDLALGHRISFGIPCRRDHVESFLKKLAASFREDQELPPHLSHQENRLRQVFLQQRELFGYRLMDELVYDLARMIEVGTALPDPPTHVLVDEYQDLTAGELRLLQLLQERCGVVVNAAGDDRQSIYGFREADPRALHRFPEIYQMENPSYLWRSSRCPRTICELANLIAAGLPPLPGLQRPPLEPWPGREDEGSAEIISYPSPKAEARAVTSRCQELLDSGVKAGDIAVIACSYHKPVYEALSAAADEAGLEDLFMDPRAPSSDVSIEMRLAATCARLLLDPSDQMAWRTLVWATPSLGEGRLTQLLRADGATFLSRLRDAAARDRVIARAVLAGDRTLQRFGNVNELNLRDVVEVACEALEISADPDSLQSLDDTPVAPNKVTQRLFELDEREREEELVSEPERVAVHTVFSAKGLQAPYVFLVNAVNESFAGRGSPADGLRLAYVGVTRASSALRISGPRFIRHTALGNQMQVDSTRVADFLQDHCAQLGIELQSVPSRA